MEQPVQPQSTPTEPWKQPHIPISEAEMSHPEHSSGGKNTLLTIASLLVLAGIVGVTLYLYIQNRQAENNQQAQNSTSQDPNNTTSNAQSEIANLAPQDQAKMEKYGVVCEMFTDLDEALEKKEVACGLDLSGQDLTSIPEEVYRLENLTELNISNNNVSELPKEVANLNKLLILDASNNNIETIPFEIANTDIQMLILTSNPLSEMPEYDGDHFGRPKIIR